MKQNNSGNPETLHPSSHSSLLTETELNQCRTDLKDIIIAPYQTNKARGIGYNLSPSELVYSLRKHGPLPIHRDDKGSFVWIKPHDTILTLSYEYLRVESNVAGTFHSRVRNVAQGLGNVSTTLDPGWKGMLLLSINNPTKKRIKLQLTKRVDGVSEPCGLITMVLWRNMDCAQDAAPTFYLDNPPMRADIWGDLIDRPYRFLRSASYAKFQAFLQKLMNFQARETPRINYLNAVDGLLLDLEIAISTDHSQMKTKSTLLKLEHMLSMDEKGQSAKGSELWKKFETLRNLVKTFLGHQALTDTDVQTINAQIDLMQRELRYLVLCEEVNQIHMLIHENVDTWQGSNVFAWVWHRYILPNLAAIVGSVLLFALLFASSLSGIDSLLGKIVVAVIPTILSVILNAIIPRKGTAE